jgi:hypothetical protein
MTSRSSTGLLSATRFAGGVGLSTSIAERFVLRRRHAIDVADHRLEPAPIDEVDWLAKAHPTTVALKTYYYVRPRRLSSILAFRAGAPRSSKSPGESGGPIREQNLCACAIAL